MPDWKTPLSARLAPLRLRPAREREIVDELSQHLDDRYHELRTEGASHEESMRLALLDIDDDGDENTGLLAREMRRLRQVSLPEPIAPGAPSRTWFGGLWQDLIYAARMLRKHRGFAAAAILTLALGIGANTALFSLVNATLLQRLPVQNRDRLVYVFNGPVGNVFSYPAYAALRDGTRTLDGLIAWGGITASLNADGETDLVGGAIVTGGFFHLLGVQAERGRILTASDDETPMAHSVAVISHRLWQGRFAGRSDIVGHQVRLNGHVFTIVGVMPPEFPGAQLGVVRDVYVPMMMQALMRPPRAGYSGEMNPDLLRNPNNGWLFTLGVLKPGVSAAEAQAELTSLTHAFIRTVNPNVPERALRPVTLVPLDDGDPNQRQQMRSAALLLGCVVGAILLIACANVANLLLSKAAARRREVAIRLALGAGRWRIVRQMLTESVMLAVLGGGAGVLLAWVIIQAFHAAPPPAGALPMVLEFAIDRRVLIFALALSVATGIVFGTVPALQASRPGLVPALKDDGFVADERGRRFDIKKALVVAEVALSLLLLITAGLFLRSLQTIRTVDPGIAACELVTAPLNVNLLRYTRPQGRLFYQQVIERMERLPGVKAASVARVAVLTGSSRVTTIAVEGRDDSGSRGVSEGTRQSADGQNTVFANVIGPRFFETTGIPLIRGRDFSPGDTENQPLVAVVSETTAKRFFPGEDPIGRRFSAGSAQANGPWTEIVGVARDSNYSTLGEEPAAVIYVPLSQHHETGVTLYVRAAVPPASLIPQIRREIQALEPNLPVPEIRTLAQTIGTSLYAQRMGTVLLAVFGGLALLLASLGVYGVLAFSISRRTRELGIRMALGADRRRIFALVIREGMWLVGIGVVLGLGAGLYASESLSRFLFRVSPTDGVTFVFVTIILLVVALLACYLPARRAIRVDPMVALRES